MQRWIDQLPPQIVRTRPQLRPVSTLPQPVATPLTSVASTDKAASANRTVLRSAPQQDLLDPLSLRELEVLHLMAQGATNGEIALALALAVETIKRHVSNILSKLGVSNRTQAAARALDLGLLGDDL